MFHRLNSAKIPFQISAFCNPHSTKYTFLFDADCYSRSLTNSAQRPHTASLITPILAQIPRTLPHTSRLAPHI